MVLRSYKTIVLLLMTLLVVACDRACQPQIDKTKSVKTQSVVSKTPSKFVLEPAALLQKAKMFSYRSELTITMSNGKDAKENKEVIEIMGESPRMAVKKRVDNYHFFEIFSDNDNYFVKSQNSPWRSGKDNKPLYQSMISDGLNTISWMVDQFSLYDRLLSNTLEKGAVTTYFVKDAPISNNSAFVRNTVNKLPAFATIEKSQIDCEISLDKKTDVPVFARCEAFIVGANEHSIRVNATTTFDTRALSQALVVPVVKNDEPIQVPVNIGPRFRELMGLAE